MSDTMSEFVLSTRALNRERSLSVVFGFERRKPDNPVSRRKAQLTRGHINISYCFVQLNLILGQGSCGLKDSV